MMSITIIPGQWKKATKAPIIIMTKALRKKSSMPKRAITKTDIRMIVIPTITMPMTIVTVNTPTGSIVFITIRQAWGTMIPGLIRGTE